MAIQQNGSGNMGKKLYLVSAEDIEEFGGYDTYSEFIACADSNEEARKMYPDAPFDPFDKNDVSVNWEQRRRSGVWIDFKDISRLKVIYLGRAHNTVKGVVLASFHAG